MQQSIYTDHWESPWWVVDVMTLRLYHVKSQRTVYAVSVAAGMEEANAS